MGRIKTVPIKRITHELIKLHPGSFTDNYEANKAVVNKMIIVQSKKLRNSVAGYLTRLVKKSKEPRKVYPGIKENLEEYYK